jgi:hypothetical protein
MSLTFIGVHEKNTAASTQTFSAVDIGAADDNRYVVVIACAADSGETISSVTIAGSSANFLAADGAIEIWYEPVSTGTTTDIVVTSATQTKVFLAVYTASSIPVLIDSGAFTESTDAAIDVETGGSVLWGYIRSQTTSSIVFLTPTYDGTDTESEDAQEVMSFPPAGAGSTTYSHFGCAHVNTTENATRNVGISGSSITDGIAVSFAGSNEVLSANAGTFTHTGKTAGLKRGLKLVTEQDEFLLTGLNAGLPIGRTMSVSVSEYSFSGFAAGLEIAGNFILTANRATFDLISIETGLKTTRTLSTSVGEFVLTGVATTLTKTYTNLTAEVQAYTLTGVEVSFTYDAPAINQFYVKDAGTWKTVGTIYVKSGGVWVSVPEVYVKQNDVWTLVFRE